VGFVKTLAVFIAALGMAAFEPVRPARGKDDDDLALFVGSAHPILARPPVSRVAGPAPRSGLR
jgi:hypothetical protein